jgi:hypothetical protein
MITIEDMYSLRDKGYYFARDGRLLSNEGELQALTSDGVLYTLRFGEVVYGKGEAVSAGVDSINAGAQGPGENRYLFITTEVDGSGGGDIARGRTLSSELNARFAGWYYVIPSSSFEKLHFTRKDLLARGPA